MHAHGNSKLIGTFLLRATIAMKPQENASQVIAFQEVVILPMGRQQGKVSKLSNGDNKQFDLDGWLGDVLHAKSVCTTILLPAGRCFGPLLLFLYFIYFLGGEVSVVLQVIKILLRRGKIFHEGKRRTRERTRSMERSVLRPSWS